MVGVVCVGVVVVVGSVVVSLVVVSSVEVSSVVVSSVVVSVVVGRSHWSGSSSSSLSCSAPFSSARRRSPSTSPGRLLDVGDQVVGLVGGDEATADVEVGLDLLQLPEQGRGVAGRKIALALVVAAATGDRQRGGEGEDGEYWLRSGHRGDTSYALLGSRCRHSHSDHWPT